MQRRSPSPVLIVLLLALVLWPSLIEAQSPSPYLSIFGKNKVQYRDFKWKVYHSPHFDVYYYTDQEELLQKVQLKFDLSPMECEFLNKHFSSKD